MELHRPVEGSAIVVGADGCGAQATGALHRILIDAFHPQTILAYEMNYAPLKVGHGAPLRLRVERQLGYKMAKYIMRIEAIDDFAKISRGRGGFWEDRGYEWYAGTCSDRRFGLKAS